MNVVDGSSSTTSQSHSNWCGLKGASQHHLGGLEGATQDNLPNIEINRLNRSHKGMARNGLAA